MNNVIKTALTAVSAWKGNTALRYHKVEIWLSQKLKERTDLEFILEQNEGAIAAIEEKARRNQKRLKSLDKNKREFNRKRQKRLEVVQYYESLNKHAGVKIPRHAKRNY